MPTAEAAARADDTTVTVHSKVLLVGIYLRRKTSVHGKRGSANLGKFDRDHSGASYV